MKLCITLIAKYIVDVNSGIKFKRRVTMKIWDIFFAMQLSIIIFDQLKMQPL